MPRSDHWEGRSRRSHSSQTLLFCETYRIPLVGGSRAWTESLHTVHAAGFLFAGAKALRSLSCLALNSRRRDADLVNRQADQPANGGRHRRRSCDIGRPAGQTVEPAAAELPFARSRDGVRETYIVSFGLFGPESVFASEAQKAAQILRARLQGEAQVLVRFNDKRGGVPPPRRSQRLSVARVGYVPGALADRVDSSSPRRRQTALIGCEDGATWTYSGDAS